MAGTMSFRTTTVAEKARVADVFAIAMRVIRLCSSPVSRTTTTGAQETPRPTSPITAQLHASWDKPSSASVRSLIASACMAFAGAISSPAHAYEPQVNYQLQCMGCHLADGSGQAGRVPSIRRSLVLFSNSREGRDYVIEVPGVAQSPLSDAQTAALLNWLARNLSDLPLPHNFLAYSAAEVQRLRIHPLAQVRARRVRLLKAAEHARVLDVGRRTSSPRQVGHVPANL